MTPKECTNIILELRKEGWSDTKIINFIAMVGTHIPTEDEVIASNESRKEN